MYYVCLHIDYAEFLHLQHPQFIRHLKARIRTRFETAGVTETQTGIFRVGTIKDILILDVITTLQDIQDDFQKDIEPEVFHESFNFIILTPNYLAPLSFETILPKLFSHLPFSNTVWIPLYFEQRIARYFETKQHEDLDLIAIRNRNPPLQIQEKSRETAQSYARQGEQFLSEITKTPGWLYLTPESATLSRQAIFSLLREKECLFSHYKGEIDLFSIFRSLFFHPLLNEETVKRDDIAPRLKSTWDFVQRYLKESTQRGLPLHLFLSYLELALSVIRRESDTDSKDSLFILFINSFSSLSHEALSSLIKITSLFETTETPLLLVGVFNETAEKRFKEEGVELTLYPEKILLGDLKFESELFNYTLFRKESIRSSKEIFVSFQTQKIFLLLDWVSLSAPLEEVISVLGGENTTIWREILAWFIQEKYIRLLPTGEYETYYPTPFRDEITPESLSLLLRDILSWTRELIQERRWIPLLSLLQRSDFLEPLLKDQMTLLLVILQNFLIAQRREYATRLLEWLLNHRHVSQKQKKELNQITEWVNTFQWLSFPSPPLSLDETKKSIQDSLSTSWQNFCEILYGYLLYTLSPLQSELHYEQFKESFWQRVQEKKITAFEEPQRTMGYLIIALWQMRLGNNREVSTQLTMANKTLQWTKSSAFSFYVRFYTCLNNFMTGKLPRVLNLLPSLKQSLTLHSDPRLHLLAYFFEVRVYDTLGDYEHSISLLHKARDLATILREKPLLSILDDWISLNRQLGDKGLLRSPERERTPLGDYFLILSELKENQWENALELCESLEKETKEDESVVSPFSLEYTTFYHRCEQSSLLWQEKEYQSLFHLEVSVLKIYIKGLLLKEKEFELLRELVTELQEISVRYKKYFVRPSLSHLFYQISHLYSKLGEKESCDFFWNKAYDALRAEAQNIDSVVLRQKFLSKNYWNSLIIKRIMPKS